MNDCIPNWNMDDDYRSFRNLLPVANQRKSMRSENELVELVWQNGHVVMQSQTNRETTNAEHKETHKHELPSKCGGPIENPHNLIQEDDNASWLPYSLDDSLEKDFCSEFFYGMPTSESIGADKLGKDAMTGDKCMKFGINEETNVFAEPLCKQSNRLHIEENTMPPPNLQTIASIVPQTSNADTGGFVNFSHFSRPVNIDTGLANRRSREKELTKGMQREVGESSSMVSKLSSNWGSNHVQNQSDLSHTLSNGVSDMLVKQMEDVQKKFHERRQTETHDTTTVTSSSGGSGSSVGRTALQTTSNPSHKRKGRDVEESESQSEEAEYQSVEGGRQSQRSASARRSRAAEVHNLSERRRRDRINEKMKALQELIPHCNKTDKASMLDEAIEYLKSLQLQVQIMWMGSGIAPMMFPSAQQYLSLMGRGIGHGSMPSIPGAVPMPRVPLVNQSLSAAAATNQAQAIPSPALNPVSFPNQMQNANIPDAYARYLGFHHMQPPPQAMNLFTPYGSQLVQPNQTAAPTGSNEPPIATAPSENAPNG